MILLGSTRLENLAKEHPDCEKSVGLMLKTLRTAKWRMPPDVKQTYRNADILKSGRIVLDIAHNKYRAVAAVDYKKGRVVISWVGTHAEYDRLDLK